jgi:hypothetical protein
VKFTSHATVQGNPKFEVVAKAEPVGLRAGCEGSVRVRVGEVRGEVGQIPIMLAVPFLGGTRVLGTVGPFGVRLDPFELSIEECELRFDAVIGPEGLTGGLEGQIGCRMQIDVDGTLPGRVSKAAIEFADADAEEDEEDGGP